MTLLSMMVQQFGVRECQKARSQNDLSRLCEQFDPIMINKYFRRKHLESVGRQKISPDIVYPTEPWFEGNNIIGIIVSEEREEIEGLEITRKRYRNWKFKFSDLLDARTNIDQFMMY